MGRSVFGGGVGYWREGRRMAVAEEDVDEEAAEEAEEDRGRRRVVWIHAYFPEIREIGGMCRDEKRRYQ